MVSYSIFHWDSAPACRAQGRASVPASRARGIRERLLAYPGTRNPVPGRASVPARPVNSVHAHAQPARSQARASGRASVPAISCRVLSLARGAECRSCEAPREAPPPSERPSRPPRAAYHDMPRTRLPPGEGEACPLRTRHACPARGSSPGGRASPRAAHEASVHAYLPTPARRIRSRGGRASPRNTF